LDLDNEKVSALLKVDKGPFYKIDSIRVYWQWQNFAQLFTHWYLDIPNIVIYSKEKLLRI
jgi:hypothetical protein